MIHDLIQTEDGEQRKRNRVMSGLYETERMTTEALLKNWNEVYRFDFLSGIETRLIQITTRAKADAEKKKIAADAEAYAVKTKAKAQAEANRMISQSITLELIKYRQIDRWNGVMPKTLVGNGKSDILLLPNK